VIAGSSVVSEFTGLFRGGDPAGNELEAVGQAVRTVVGGESLPDPKLAAKVMAKLRAAEEHKDPLALLTAQKRLVLELVGEGMTNRQVAEQLFLAEKTVKNHVPAVPAVLAKLGLTRRVKAVLVSEARSEQAHHRR
jgi:two-component system, NarL family, response regulator DevR